VAKPGGSRIIIVKKKVKGGHGAHGGSWKVAYADFVTAMMAFFMVMWILGMDENTRKAIEGYFSNPIGFKKGYSSGASPLASGSSPASVQRQAVMLALRKLQEQRFQEVSALLRTRVDSASIGGLKAKVEITVTKTGLRIELIEAGRGDTFFPFGSPVMRETGRRALSLIAGELIRLENPVVIEGHTDAARYARRDYTNWELSAGRANAARRILEELGLPASRVVEVIGMADKVLKYPAEPLNPANRRISILLPFLDAPQPRTIEALSEQIDSVSRILP
jgi:chemotaxis protein MotB